LNLSKTQAEIQSAVRAYAQSKIKPQAKAFEAAGEYPASLFVELGEMGLLGMTVPESQGGALALMELAAVDGALSTIVSVQSSIMVAGISKHGTPQQRERFLPGLISGHTIGAFALTEAEAGSDAAAIRTRATRSDGGWVLNGGKVFITSGKTAGVAMIVAVTDPAAGEKGLSAFLVPTDRPGYTVERVEHKLGQQASDTCALRFDNLFVEDELVFGAIGEGYRIALSNLETGRIGIAAQSVGMAQAAMEIAVSYAKDRKSFGQRIIDHQAVGFRLASLATRLEAARQLVLAAAARKDADSPSLVAASMAKLFASETAEAVVSGAIQTLGGYGYLEEFELAKIYRDVRVCQIYEGTSDVQLMVIARAL
jgi:alkylation response protein AidB-like acyl-CoA dehydrogenase